MEFSPVGRVCSFCGLVGTRDTKFAGGLGAMMCQDCLEYYHQAFATKKRLAAISHPPWESMTDAELLSKLPLIAATSDQVEVFLRDWIKLVRARNISWAEIGKVMGISRQAAWERFREVGDTTAAGDATA
jgi:hypothetical protein